MTQSVKFNKLDKALLYLICVAVLLLAIYAIGNFMSKKDVAYIDIGRLAENYEFKKDLENAAAQNLYKIREAIDSLKMLQKVVGNNAHLDSQVIYAQQVFNDYYAKSNKEINVKIWERLNPVIEQYGKDKQLMLLIGANGAGSLLYADEKRDLTDDLTDYVNKKYAKGN